MKNLIAIFSTLALMAGVGVSNASADNFFTKLGRSMRRAHERHEEMMEDFARAARHGMVIRIGENGYGDGCGHYETVEEQVWIDGGYVTQIVEVHEPGHWECKEVVEVVTPARCERVYVPPVYRTEIDCCGKAIRVMVKCGYWTTREIPAVTVCRQVRVWVEGECRQVPRRVWVEGRYETKCVRVWVCD